MIEFHPLGMNTVPGFSGSTAIHGAQTWPPYHSWSNRPSAVKRATRRGAVFGSATRKPPSGEAATEPTSRKLSFAAWS